MKDVLNSSDLYGIRMLVFLEENVDSNKYRQVVFTRDEFRKVSLSVGKIVQEGEHQIVDVGLSEEVYDLPDLKEWIQEDR